MQDLKKKINPCCLSLKKKKKIIKQSKSNQKRFVFQECRLCRVHTYICVRSYIIIIYSGAHKRVEKRNGRRFGGRGYVAVPVSCAWPRGVSWYVYTHTVPNTHTRSQIHTHTHTHIYTPTPRGCNYGDCGNSIYIRIN